MPITRAVLPSPAELLLARDDDVAGIRLRRDPGFARVRAGVYAPTTAWRSLTPWDRYLARVHAHALVHPDAVFSHESAAVLLGLPVFGEPRDIHLFDPLRTRSHRAGDVIVHTSQDARELIDLGPFRTTSPVDTAIDLARVLPAALALAVVDAVISPRGGGFALADAVDRAREQRSTRGIVKLRWIWERADARAESPGESVSRAVIEWWGFERPELQVTFRYEGYEDRTDFYWPGLRLIGESDGYGKYDGGDPEETKRRLLAEKRREDRLRRHEGGFVRWDWADAVRAAPLRDKLLAAGLTQSRPPQRALLATLRSHPRSR